MRGRGLNLLVPGGGASGHWVFTAVWQQLWQPGEWAGRRGGVKYPTRAISELPNLISNVFIVAGYVDTSKWGNFLTGILFSFNFYRRCRSPIPRAAPPAAA